MSEYNENENPQKQQTHDERRTDFYVIIDYKKMRGVKLCDMEDGDGDKCDCIVIPLLKNGIRAFTKRRWRVILAHSS